MQESAPAVLPGCGFVILLLAAILVSRGESCFTFGCATTAFQPAAKYLADARAERSSRIL